MFHLGFNIALALLFIGFTGRSGATVERLLPEPKPDAGDGRPHHLDPLALTTPSLAISCAAREALHQADVVETMLRGMLAGDPQQRPACWPSELRQLDDTVDELYSAIKFYLTQISREALSEEESRRWTDIVSLHDQHGADRRHHRARAAWTSRTRRSGRAAASPTPAWPRSATCTSACSTTCAWAMSVFLDGHVRDAQKLLEEKARFRDLEHDYAATHLARLRDNTAQSIETSSLHIDLISDLKRINSHICSIAYPILESAGALTKTRIRHSQLAELGPAELSPQDLGNRAIRDTLETGRA